jgi:hypothetical protein
MYGSRSADSTVVVGRGLRPRQLRWSADPALRDAAAPLPPGPPPPPDPHPTVPFLNGREGDISI